MTGIQKTAAGPRLCLRIVFSLVILSTLAASQPKNAATIPEPRTGEPARRHEQLLKRTAKGDVDVLFLGDSITEGWEREGKEAWAKHFEPLKAANFGIGGDRTQHVLWRITTGKELEGLSPRAAVLMIGTNNAGANSADEVADGVEAVVRELREQKPDMKILLLGVFPRSGKAPNDPDRVAADELNTNLPDVNKRIAQLDDGKMVKYLDVGPKFLDSEGGLSQDVMPDYLHLSPKGYEIWAEAIKGPVNELLK